MVSEDQWFLVSNSKTPELINETGLFAKRVYEDEGLHGMDFRRYLAFAATFKHWSSSIFILLGAENASDEAINITYQNLLNCIKYFQNLVEEHQSSQSDSLP